MAGKVSEDPDKAVDGTEKVAAVHGGNNFGILISSIRTWIVGSLTKSSVGLSNVDNTADAAKPVSTAMSAALAGKQSLSAKGAANGYADLDSSGKVPTAQLPDAVLGALKYQGTWNANTNSPAIPSASSGNMGWYFMVATAGATAIDGITDWKVGDWLVSNGAAWDKIDNTDAVNSVAGLTGAISAVDLRTALSLVIGTDVVAQSHVGSGGTAHANAVAGGAAGFMSGADKATLDKIGEYFETDTPFASAVTLTTNTAKTIASISLQAGDYDAEGLINFLSDGTVSASRYLISLSAANDAAAASGNTDHIFQAFANLGFSPGYPVRTKRFSLSSPATIYLVGLCQFSGGTMKAFGNIRARRVR